MEAKEQSDQGINIQFSRAEALVFYEWLVRFTSEERPHHFNHGAEEQILFNFEACLEKILVEQFEENYSELIRIYQESVFPTD